MPQQRPLIGAAVLLGVLLLPAPALAAGSDGSDGSAPDGAGGGRSASPSSALPTVCSALTVAADHEEVRAGDDVEVEACGFSGTTTSVDVTVIGSTTSSEGTAEVKPDGTVRTRVTLPRTGSFRITLEGRDSSESGSVSVEVHDGDGAQETSEPAAKDSEGDSSAGTDGTAGEEPTGDAGSTASEGSEGSDGTSDTGSDSRSSDAASDTAPGASSGQPADGASPTQDGGQTSDRPDAPVAEDPQAPDPQHEPGAGSAADDAGSDDRGSDPAGSPGSSPASDGAADQDEGEVAPASEGRGSHQGSASGTSRDADAGAGATTREASGTGSDQDSGSLPATAAPSDEGAASPPPENGSDGSDPTATGASSEGSTAPAAGAGTDEKQLRASRQQDHRSEGMWTPVRMAVLSSLITVLVASVAGLLWWDRR
ncbi:hypothetical protein DEO23_04875 [Brachybacterium endophyticum]|uniref:Uncharacterized protein n=1 Tax=Brachybacterium endophyticum TaxID=2182385 RepID=A0A2U2RKC0_9MICO|nr:hypothetical protein [Brachybacterium endophyticum]PWH06322.1 hypothetical protein DEO23_04875 [Brachybacterium endophyticum]